MWDSLDVDHDDKISYSEFEQFCVQKQRRRSIMSMAAKSATKRRLYKQTVKTIVSEAATLGHLKTSRRRATCSRSAASRSARACARRSRRLPDFWAGWSCFEASLWTANYLVGGVALYKVTTNRKDAIRGGEGLGAFRL